MGVGLVVVSHSSKIAAGVVELAAQMAPDVRIAAAGGTDDDGIGTSFERVTAGVGEADDGSGVVILCDLGSAILTAETALDFLDPDVAARVRIADAPLVEGAVAAAVAAQTGGTLDDVVRAAQTAGGSGPAAVDTAASGTITGASEEETPSDPERAEGTATLINASGLHARPAAEFVRLASTFDARITLNGVDAKSLLRIMGLGLGKGSVVRIEATGPQARVALDELVALLGSGFGE